MAVQTLTIGYLVVIITWNGCGCNALFVCEGTIDGSCCLSLFESEIEF